MRIKIPDGYSIQDAFPKPSFLDSNGNKITDTAKLKDLEADLWKGLLVVSSTDRNNLASINLVLATANTGDFEQYYSFSKTMQQVLAKQQFVEHDTSSAVLNVDGIRFNKFLAYSRKNDSPQYSGIYIANVRQYYLIIKSDYIDKTFGELFEKAILESRFD